MSRSLVATGQTALIEMLRVQTGGRLTDCCLAQCTQAPAPGCFSPDLGAGFSRKLVFGGIRWHDLHRRQSPPGAS
jgi:hypothetical protein